MRMPGYPELMTVGNTEERDRDSKIRNGAALWHTDQSYDRVPASATMLYSIIAPREGGQTQFCDMASAYDALDADTRRRIETIEVAHKCGRGKRLAGEAEVNPIINEDQDRRVPPVYHPLVMRHPVTQWHFVSCGSGVRFFRSSQTVDSRPVQLFSPESKKGG